MFSMFFLPMSDRSQVLVAPAGVTYEFLVQSQVRLGVRHDAMFAVGQHQLWVPSIAVFSIRNQVMSSCGNLGSRR